jgi:hypothetical protein
MGKQLGLPYAEPFQVPTRLVDFTKRLPRFHSFIRRSSYTCLTYEARLCYVAK